MITQDTIQQILSRIDIIDIVGSFVKLRKRGTNYIGLCPFHNEKSPSFTVSPTKEIYKCFGCGKSGNSIGFIMELEKYSYVEALRWLANKYNVEIQETEVSPEVKLTQQAADSLYIINSFAQKFFSDTLFNSDEGQDVAMSYLKERGFREDIIRKFQIGYNPSSRDTFAAAAIHAKYNIDFLQKSGLVVVRDDRPMDNYRGRIIFPIHNQSGKVLGFGARVIKTNDRAPKYINTPENEIYVKSKILYGSYFARMAIDKADECLLVEGYTDVISLHQAGVENVVASGGTSLTPDQLRLVKKYTSNLTIIYDGDGAGVKAALRGMDLALEEGLNVKLVLIPDKEDPDSYVNKIGAEAFKEFVRLNKKDFILFQLEVSLKDAGSDSTKKSQLVNQVAETISKITKAEEFTRRQDYVKQVSEILKIEESGMNNLVNKFIRDKVTKDEQRSFRNDPAPVIPEGMQEMPVDDDVQNLFNKDEMNERALIRALLEFGIKKWDEHQSVADFLFEQIGDNELDKMMENQDLLKVYELYKVYYKEGLNPTSKNFLYHEDSRITSLAIELTDNVYSQLSLFWKNTYEGQIPMQEDVFKNDVISSLNYLKLRKIKKLIFENNEEMSRPHSDDEMMLFLQTAQHLKQMEIEITKHIGTVIIR